MNLLVRGGRLFRRGAFEAADLLVREGRIEALGPPGSFPPSGPAVEAAGLLVLPALVDAHVHFREPGLERKEGWETGSRAAARGGVGTVLEIQNNDPLTTDPDRLAEREARARAKSIVDFGLYANLLPASRVHLGRMAETSPGFKAFLGGTIGHEGIRDSATIHALFAAAAAAGRPVVVHAEDAGILAAAAPERPAAAETVAAATAIECAAATGAEVHLFHVSAGRTADLVEDARARGLPVSASVCPHYLLFTEEEVRSRGAWLRVKPPIRGRADRERLRAALASGAIEALTTDHAPHPREEKEGPSPPFGLPSVDLLLPLLFALRDEAGIPLERLLAATSEVPARLFRILGKGRLEPGADADFVLVDPERRFGVEAAGLSSRAGWSPYEGREMRGAPVATYVRGRAVFDRGRFASAPHGLPVRLEGPKIR
ncbi:MAG: dihydroorotase family protein [Planctomycetes bacterium]|nr:dihydroorotase family protein [Planctomycetota bacterium]